MLVNRQVQAEVLHRLAIALLVAFGVDQDVDRIADDVDGEEDHQREREDDDRALHEPTDDEDRHLAPSVGELASAPAPDRPIGSARSRRPYIAFDFKGLLPRVRGSWDRTLWNGGFDRNRIPPATRP